MERITVNGVNYRSRVVSGASCNGCAGNSFGDKACRSLPACGGQGKPYIHWIKERVQPVAVAATPALLPAPQACDPGPSMARSTDPATSKGKRRVNKYEQAVLSILNGLYEGQGYTGKQIATLTGHPLNCITPRFAPLRRKGLIKDSGLRRDKQIVWVLA